MNYNSIFKGITIASLLLLILAIGQFYMIGNTDDVSFYQAFIELIKIIIVGFLIGALGIMIPQMLPFKKYEFELKKEAREKYSEAKTEIDYLPHRLQFITSPEAALNLVKDIHTKKHLAETYAEYLPEKNPNGKNPSDKIWDKDHKPFEKLKICRDEIQKNRDKWSSISIGAKFELIQEELRKLKKAEDKN